MVWLARTDSTPRRSPASSSSIRSAAAAAASTARASPRKARPAPVSSMPRPTRWNSRTPRPPSSAATVALAADCARPSAAAARVTCWCSATATKTRSCPRVRWPGGGRPGIG